MRLFNLSVTTLVITGKNRSKSKIFQFQTRVVYFWENSVEFQWNTQFISLVSIIRIPWAVERSRKSAPLETIKILWEEFWRGGSGGAWWWCVLRVISIYCELFVPLHLADQSDYTRQTARAKRAQLEPNCLQNSRNWICDSRYNDHLTHFSALAFASLLRQLYSSACPFPPEKNNFIHYYSTLLHWHFAVNDSFTPIWWKCAKKKKIHNLFFRVQQLPKCVTITWSCRKVKIERNVFWWESQSPKICMGVWYTRINFLQ